MKSWSENDEQYGDIYFQNSGYAKVTATVADDSEALFTPCTYKLENFKVLEGPKLEPIREIVSFRGRFCEQARKGEKVIVQGKVEHVNNKRQSSVYFRVLIGNAPADYMTLSQL